MDISNEQIQSIVQQVVKNVIEKEGVQQDQSKTGVRGDWGVFEDINDAIEAASRAFLQFEKFDIQDRKVFTDAVRQVCLDHKEEFSRMTVKETKMGRVDHKIKKHINAARNSPGVEYLQPQSWSGKNGLAVDDYSPYGVIGNITPSTHPVPVMINNIVIQLAGGNTIAFNPHPAAKRVNAYCIKLCNQYLVKAGAPPNLVTCVREPTLEFAETLFAHPKTKLLSVSGGPQIVAAAMKHSKRVVAAGPGNPPVVVDETADLEHAAREISVSASYDNNVLCTAEKEVFVVESVFDPFMKAFEKQGNVRLTTSQMDTLAQKVFEKSGDSYYIGRDYVGRNANVLAKVLGKNLSEEVPLLFGETSAEHPWVFTEQLTSCIPIIHVKNFEEGMALAFKAEQGFKHTASIFTRDMYRATTFAKRLNCDIVVINGGTPRGDGGDLGEGTFSHTIASETGEGICTPLEFVRKRRIMVTEAMRFV